MVARWYIFRPKISILIYFWGLWEGQFWYILWPFCIFNAVWCTLWSFGIFCGPLVYISQFGHFVPRKIWQPCVRPSFNVKSFGGCSSKFIIRCQRKFQVGAADPRRQVFETWDLCYDHNFRRKNWRFSQKPMLWSKFFKIYLRFESKAPIFSLKFLAKILKNHNIGPWNGANL
jgi:hypothetical protein